MSNQLEIRTAQLGKLAEALSDAAEEIQEEISQINDASSVMLRGWEGDAAEAFRHRRAQVLGDLSVRRHALGVCSELASAIESIYAQADVELARIFGEG